MIEQARAASSSVAVAGVIVRGGRVLLQQRRASEVRGGYWELPGGTVEPGEDIAAALSRELREEIGIVDVESESIGVIESDGFVVHFFRITRYRGVVSAREGQAIDWLAWDEAISRRTLAADLQMLSEIATTRSADSWESVWVGERYSRPTLRKSRALQKMRAIARAGLKLTGVERVLDVGAGSGDLGVLVSQTAGSYVALERSPSAVARIRARNLEVIMGSAERMPIEDGTIDVVLLIGVLEHVPREADVISEMARVLSPAGTFFLVTSHTRSVVYRVRRLRERFNIWPYSYQKNHMIEQLTESLQMSGLRVTHSHSEHVDWDFPVSALLDRCIAVFARNWGRYLVVAGSKG